MESNNMNQPMKTALNELKVYLDLQLKLNKAVVGKKAEELSSQLFLVLIMAGIAAFVLLFLTFGFVSWYAVHWGQEWVGYLLVSAFYLLVGILIYLFRDAFVSKPIRKNINEMLLDEELDLPVGVKPSDKVFFNVYIQLVKEKANRQEAVLKQSFKNIGESFNVEHVFRKMLVKTYQSFVTTKNIAKAVYYVSSKLRGKIRHKKKKKLKD